MGEKIQAWVQAQVVRPVPWEPHFISRLFPVPKKGGDIRPVFDLRELNQYVVKEHFQMEGMSDLPFLLRQSDWMIKLDIKDAYQHIPIAPEFQTLLGFLWEGQYYVYQTVPFGLTSAPRIFTKLLKPVVAELRRQGVRMIIYMDDLLIMADSPAQAIEHRDKTLTSLMSLGFLINWPKSILQPAQMMEFLGYKIDTVSMTLALPSDKVTDLRRSVADMLQRQETISVRELSSLLGKASASAMAVTGMRLRTRSLLRDLRRALAETAGHWEARCPLSEESLRELSTWQESIAEWNGRPVLPVPPQVVINTDASTDGWGAVILARNLRTRGTFSLEEQPLHINDKELLAVEFALHAFRQEVINKAVLVRSDNMTTVAYLNHMGGTISPRLSAIAERIWRWALEHRIHLMAEHVPGVDNVEADAESRAGPDRHDWQLHPEIFRAISQLWGPFEVDMFASRANAQLTTYFSWRPDPAATAIDAMVQPWDTIYGFANPPWVLLSRVLAKIRAEQARVVLVAPVWPTRPWFPLLLELVVDHPRIIPQTPDIPVFLPALSDWGAAAPSLPPGDIAAWRLSGVPSERADFLSKLAASAQHGGRQHPSPTMTLDGESLLIGWSGATPIHAARLW